jgi:hypothetical protein
LLAFLLADHSGRAVQGMNCLRSLERWDRGFESHSRHGCLHLFRVCVVLCVDSGPAGRAIAQAVSRWLPTAAARVQLRVWSGGICG